MYVESQNVGYPQNAEVLKQILVVRGELAKALGFENWAPTTPRREWPATAHRVRLHRQGGCGIRGGCGPRICELVARKQQDAPGAVQRWDRQRYGELVRRANYDFDSQSLRPYFRSTAS
jgi:thimet oligopeptidase